MVYLIEYAKSGRSTCKGPKKGCVSENNTIAKGALRLGVETEINGTTRVTWRHWLCTTPKVLANMSEAMSEPEEISGFDTISEKDQERIREAWTDGELPTDADKVEGDDSQSNDEKEEPKSSSQSKDAESSKTADKESDETSKDDAETKDKEKEDREENDGDKKESSNGGAKKVGNAKSKSTKSPKHNASAKAKKAEKPRTEPTRRSTRVQATAAPKEKAESAKGDRSAASKRKAPSSGTPKKKSKKN